MALAGGARRSGPSRRPGARLGFSLGVRHNQAGPEDPLGSPLDCCYHRRHTTAAASATVAAPATAAVHRRQQALVTSGRGRRDDGADSGVDDKGENNGMLTATAATTAATMAATTGATTATPAARSTACGPSPSRCRRDSAHCHGPGGSRAARIRRAGVERPVRIAGPSSPAPSPRLAARIARGHPGPCFWLRPVTG